MGRGKKSGKGEGEFATTYMHPTKALEFGRSPVASPHAADMRFNTEPQDMVVFATDAAGNKSSLTLNCSASGNPSPNITWFREGMPLSNEMVNTNGTLLIMNITEGVDATRGGVSYHCTANNTFGIILSRAANVSYACELRGRGVCPCRRFL